MVKATSLQRKYKRFQRENEVEGYCKLNSTGTGTPFSQNTALREGQSA